MSVGRPLQVADIAPAVLLLGTEYNLTQMLILLYDEERLKLGPYALPGSLYEHICGVTWSRDP
jgi:hypothetical protein